MNIRENYINKYSLSKTLRFSLIPQGKTLENIEKNGTIDVDNLRAENYRTVKTIIDRKHKFFIENVLNSFRLDEKLNEYYALYKNKSRSQKEQKDFEKSEENLRKQIAIAFTKNEDYKKLSGTKLFDELLYSLAENEEEAKALDMFANGFTTYFYNFNINRKNMYSKENKSTAICYRLITQNLPKFIDNILAFEKIQKSGLSEEFENIQNEFEGLGMFNIRDVFSIDYYNFALSQSGIDRYNNFIGGYSNEDGSKVKGLNEKINNYNQHHTDEPKLPFLKPLFKQILSDSESISFIADKFDSDNETLKSIDKSFDDQFFYCYW